VCLKTISEFFGEKVRASGLRDKELEFLASEIFKVNYFGKVEKMIFGKATWGAGSKLLGR